MNVVITGASAGIGRALAVTFARKGHPVLAVARREERTPVALPGNGGRTGGALSTIFAWISPRLEAPRRFLKKRSGPWAGCM